jgi:hypothetical protein
VIAFPTSTSRDRLCEFTHSGAAPFADAIALGAGDTEDGTVDQNVDGPASNDGDHR